MTAQAWFYVDRHDAQHGPVDDVALRAAWRAGAIDRNSLVWREGLTAWQAVQTLPELSALLRSATDQEMARLAAALADAEQDSGNAGQHGLVADRDIVYAGFWRRYLALFIDQLILSAVASMLLVIAFFIASLIQIATSDFAQASPTWLGYGLGLVYLVYFAVAGVYYSAQESSSHQATFGKRAMGIKVVDYDGRRLSFGHALGRWLAASLSYVCAYIGFLLAGFTERKQALHDFVAGSLVVDRWAYTDHPERQQRGLSGCLIAFIVAIVLMLALSVLGIFAAIAVPAYNDYRIRSNIVHAMTQAASLKVLIAEHVASNGICPSNGHAGIGQAKEYASANVERIETGPLAGTNHCRIQLELRNLPLAGEREQIWLEYQPDSFTWSCSTSLPMPYRPATCRLSPAR